MSKSICTVCNEVFKSSYGFDKHRTGEHSGKPIMKNGKVAGYEPGTRRCKTIKEMIADGMVKNDKGQWVTALNNYQHATEDSIPIEQ